MSLKTQSQNFNGDWIWFRLALYTRNPYTGLWTCGPKRRTASSITRNLRRRSRRSETRSISRFTFARHHVSTTLRPQRPLPGQNDKHLNKSVLLRTTKSFNEEYFWVQQTTWTSLDYLVFQCILTNFLKLYFPKPLFDLLNKLIQMSLQYFEPSKEKCENLHSKYFYEIISFHF